LIDFRGSLRAAKKGDEDAFARIWREFHPGLVRYLKIKAASDAEDLAADTWYGVIRALGSFEGDQDGFRAWLYTSARNRLTDWYRGSHRRPDLIERSTLLMIPAANDVEAEAEENSGSDAAIALIAELPPDQAEAVMLRIVAGLDVSTVAMIMRRTPGSVRVLSHRGLRRLEEALEATSPADDSSRDHVRLEATMLRTGNVAVGSHLSEVHNG
jgi:RNA polymerase sigma-70 factor (ECF subfamily)